MASSLALRCSSWFPGVLGAEVDDAREDSWRGSFMAWLYLAAKISHVGVDVDGLACPLHRPMVRCCSGRWHLLGDVKPPGLGYLVES
jgi:hypothetical protein